MTSERWAPAARPSDPYTSKQAEIELTESGRRTTLAAQCLAAVQTLPGQTAGEIGDITGLGHERVWRRLSDLKNQGKIVQGEPQQWHGKSQVTWWPAPKAEPEVIPEQRRML